MGLWFWFRFRFRFSKHSADDHQCDDPDGQTRVLHDATSMSTQVQLQKFPTILLQGELAKLLQLVKHCTVTYGCCFAFLTFTSGGVCGAMDNTLALRFGETFLSQVRAQARRQSPGLSRA
ncbi:hypothetical protein PoB_006184100 [Plakobranchus ocellatus]|uniref:Uncharacterized protein n=1 Tax=Plakobranchus ocellatus TaxID=259542 RepID=A0AAV4CTU1_9GAST|nr:hypothetical protein PoB_006184100 [Plakobranchus ocellatus]